MASIGYLLCARHFVQALSTHYLQYSQHLARQSLRLLTPTPQDTLHYTANLTLHPGHLSSCLISLLSLKPFHISKDSETQRVSSFALCYSAKPEFSYPWNGNNIHLPQRANGAILHVHCMFLTGQECNLSRFSGVIERPQGRKIWVVVCHNRRGSGPRG